MNERLEEYDGTTAAVRTEHLPAEEVEFMRWKAERWMKIHHIPAVVRHDPGFVLFQGWKMWAHTFRGSSIRSALGLESDKKVFERYRAIRRAEREYVSKMRGWKHVADATFRVLAVGRRAIPAPAPTPVLWFQEPLLYRVVEHRQQRSVISRPLV
jgi:hypothetical protein